MIILNRLGSRIAGAFLFIFVILLVFGWLNRTAILQGAADLWVVSDIVENADAAVVLGGGLNTRPFAAADLYNAGKVRFVLVTAGEPSRMENSLAILSHTELNRAVLINRGVPLQSIILVGHDVANTYQESRAVREWAQQTGAKKIIIVTEMFSSRRVRWIFDRQLATIGVKTIIYALPHPNYDYRRWWQGELGVIEFQNEVLKYLYYRLKY
jgi:uncharacterized SAM-binding protein YcdF (DUF218 family)